ncbi:peptide chain release factor 2 [Alphaproteobacteria bacterium]|nr:peptide chain release factor 2 [Alphaproteobacteria bacterium]
MKYDFEKTIKDINDSLTLLRRHLDWDNSSKRLDYINSLIESSSFWDDPISAQNLMKERNNINDSINIIKDIDLKLNDIKQLIDLGIAENDNETVEDAIKDLLQLKNVTYKYELETLLSGEADENDCFLEVHPGAGGTESQDWAQMLVRMYHRWAESRGFKFEWLEESIGEEAGIKSSTVKISGNKAFGWFKTETGVHRLVRISPFDSSSRRHTSFASVGVYPVIDDKINIEIEEKDLRIDTYRASGAGGQHVNRTDSAVRITHDPSEIVVQCQSERSQHKNKAAAMKMLKSRLYDLEIKKRENEKQADYNSKSDIGWGYQIRSYVLHPYQLVKDLRTGVEKGNAQGVLDGDLDELIEASLSLNIKKENS